MKEKQFTYGLDLRHQELKRLREPQVNTNITLAQVLVTQHMKTSDKAGKAKIITLEESEEKENDPNWKNFWKGLGGKGPTASAEASGDDAVTPGPIPLLVRKRNFSRGF